MGFRDNVKSLYDYLIENKYNTKYEIICSASDYKLFRYCNLKNVKFESNIRGVFTFFRAGFVFYSFGKLPIIPGNNQIAFQLWHGCPYKAPDESMFKGHSWERQYYTHVLSSSKHFIPIWSYLFSIPEKKVVVTGLPRNDALFKKYPKYDFGEYRKIILWAPTFRASKVLGYTNVSDEKNIVPVLKEDEFGLVDKYLAEKGVKIVVKLHPMQNLDAYHLINNDYFKLMSHQEFVRSGIDLYKLMTQCDALITDYSSIFYDFLLLDRPMAFTEDDLDDYSDKRGFVVDDPQFYKAGMRVKSILDLYRFIDSVADGIDNYKEERDRVNALVNDYKDGHFSKRVLECVGICK